MTTNTFQRFLGFDPANRGIGFAVLEVHPIRLLDWGVLLCQDKRYVDGLEGVKKLITEYSPTSIVIEDYRDIECRRSRTAQHILQSIRLLGRKLSIPVIFVTTKQLKSFFGAQGASTKERRAVAVAERFPELKPRLPAPRAENIGGIMRPIRSQDYRMSIFDAAALGLTLTDEK